MPTPTSVTHPTADGWGIHPRLVSYIALILRAGLGFGMFNMGLYQFMAQGSLGNVRQGVNPYSQIVNIIPGTEPLYIVLPYVQIGVGLALILGFLTTAAAVTAGAVILVTPLMQSVGLIASGPTMNRFNQFDPSLLSLLFSGDITRLLHVAIVLWLSPVSKNPWSLDGLMFGVRQRKVGETAYPLGPSFSGQSWPGALIGGQRLIDDPLAPFETSLVKQFDPDSVTNDPLGPGSPS